MLGDSLPPSTKGSTLFSNHKLALDIALYDARVVLSVDLAEDGTVERLLRRLALGRRPRMLSVELRPTTSEPGVISIASLFFAFGIRAVIVDMLL